MAIQLLGGAGYTRDYPIEQYYRDNRLNPIHEGTFGIQSLDLLGRKLWQHQGKGLSLLMQRIQQTLTEVSHPEIQTLATIFRSHLDTVQKTTQTLGAALQQGKIQEGLANSALYLDMMGKTMIAWLWLEMANKAHLHYAASTQEQDQHFWLGKLQAARYFIRWELPEIEHQAKLLCSFDDSCSAMQADWF